MRVLPARRLVPLTLLSAVLCTAGCAPAHDTAGSSAGRPGTAAATTHSPAAVPAPPSPASASTIPAAAPACTAANLQAALPKTPTQWVTIVAPHTENPVTVFCSGDWAATYASNYEVSGGQTYETGVTVVLRRSAGAWHEVDRTQPCADHVVPAAIYQPACETD